MNRLSLRANRSALLLLVMVAIISWIAAGCASYEQESNWQWRQFSPEYRPPLQPAE